MALIHLQDCSDFKAGDGCTLREMLHPDKADLSLRYSLAHATVAVGQTTTPHRLKTSEVYFILYGQGRMHIDDQIDEVGLNDTVYIPPLATQYIENIGHEPLVFICIVDPAWRQEDEEVLT